MAGGGGGNERETSGFALVLREETVMHESAVLPPTDPDSLQQAIDTFRVYCGVVLLSFAQHGQGLRETVARRFIARGMSCTQNIFAVWRAGSEHDAWILHRSLIDRLFHLHYLGKTDGFSEFDDFSFAALYEARQQLLADPDMRSKLPESLKDIQQRDKARYERIPPRKSRWQRPKAKDVAKQMDLCFLYSCAYDYASAQVHPTFDEGEADYEILTKPPGTVALPNSTVVTNSILIHTMLVQEALNISEMRWHVLVYDFLDHMHLFLKTGEQQFQLTMREIAQFWPASQLCEPPSSKG
jgi:hypothetical protein